VLPHLRVGILADGVPVDPGREGEIVISGRSDGEWGDSYHPMLGYHHQPDDSVESLRDGLLYTGDVGILDDDANLTVCGRQRSLILRGGANVYPAEVERVVLEFPGVVGVAVVGMADERLGQRVGAAVEIAPGAQVHEVDLEAHCRSCLARYKVPERWLFRALPRNAMGKVTTSDVESWFADPTP
jgi:acyl-CoA synthetase (AMP-forming)/AMP-acid ligase II